MLKLQGDSVARLREHYRARRVCVTGGAGFIGGHVVDALLSLGARITVIDDLSNSAADHLAELVELEPERVSFLHASILDEEALREAFEGAETVFHLAAIGSVQRSVAEPVRCWTVNATGTVRVLEAARRAVVARVVNSSSSSVYGDQAALPKHEGMALEPLSPYAASKAAGEAAVRSWCASYKMSAVSLRYFNVFGPRQAADSAYAAVVAAFMRAVLSDGPVTIFGDGQQSRDYTFVANAVLANLLAGAAPRELSGEAVNVGTGRRVTLLELAKLVADACARPRPRVEHAPPRPADVRHSQADTDAAHKLLGYTPAVTIEEGLAATASWYRQALAEQSS